MDAPALTLFVGVDVQRSRGCPVVAIDEDGRFVAQAWITDADQGDLSGPAPDTREPGTIPSRLRGAVLGLAAHHRARVIAGIDAPRCPLPAPRAHYWDGGLRGRWRRRRPTERGLGRHCELVVSALGLARPQWTPIATASVPPWMSLGFACFAALATIDPLASGRPSTIDVHEVFPSASYRLFEDRPPRIDVLLDGFARGPKDMLDAYCAAATVREVAQGRGWLAGGGDGLGAIALPGSMVAPGSAVHAWPGPEATG